MKNTLIKYLVLACSITILFGACRKDSYLGAQTGDAGTTYVRVTEATLKSQFFTPFTEVKAVNMFSVRRDAANKTDLSKTVAVTLTQLPQSYLDTHYPGYTLIDPSVFTYATDASIKTTADNSSLVFTFASGDFAKNVILNVNGSLLDPSIKYAMAYAITDAQGVKYNAGLDTIVSTIGIKNAYDGQYKVSGSITRNSANGPDATLGGTYPDGIVSNVATIGATTNTFNIVWINNTAVGGIAGLRLAVDPATNNVTVSATGNATLKNTPGAVNKYDPGTKTFTLNFDWGTAPSTRIFSGTLTYSKPL